jgi:hypothetical protein
MAGSDSDINPLLPPFPKDPPSQRDGSQYGAVNRPVAAPHIFTYIVGMLWRNSRGRPMNAPAAFIHPCQPVVAKQPPSGTGWAHELKHDGYRLQIHVRDGRVRLYTMNGADWSKTTR